MDVSSSSNFLKREAAYLAARERIFGIEEVEFKETARQKPRHDPAVARRMISHALGQKITQSPQVKGDGSGCDDDVKPQDEKLPQRDSSDSRSSKDAAGVSKTRTREQNLGAAKRMFANAMGIPASKDAVPKLRGVKTTTSTE